MKRFSKQSTIFLILLALLLSPVIGCIDPNGNLDLVTGNSTNSLSTGEQSESSTNANDALVPSDVESITDTNLDNPFMEPASLPVTISKLNDDLFLKATKIGVSFENSETNSQDTTSVVGYGADWFVDSANAETDGAFSRRINFFGKSGAALPNETLVLRNADGEELKVLTDGFGRFQTELNKDFWGQEFLVYYEGRDATVEDDEVANLSFPTLGALFKRDGSFAVNISRGQKEVYNIQFLAYNNVLFYDVKVGSYRTLHLVKSIDGGKSYKFAVSEEPLNQKYFFEKNDSDIPSHFLAGLTESQVVMKVEPDAVYQLTDSEVSEDQSRTPIESDLAAPKDGKFFLQSINYDDFTHQLYLIPNDPAGRDLKINYGMKRDLAATLMEQYLAWSSGDQAFGLSFYRYLKNDGDEDPENEDLADDDIRYKRGYIITRMNMKPYLNKSPEELKEYIASVDGSVDVPVDIVHNLKVSCKHLEMTDSAVAGQLLLATVCRDEKGISQLVLSNLNKIVYLTNSNHPVFGKPKFNRTGTMIAYTVKVGQKRTAIQVIDLRTLHRSWVISPDLSIDNEDVDYEALPVWSKTMDSVLTFLVYSKGENRIGVSNLKLHPDFSKLFEGNLPENLSAIGDLSHIFSSDTFKPVPTRPTL